MTGSGAIEMLSNVERVMWGFAHSDDAALSCGGLQMARQDSSHADIDCFLFGYCDDSWTKFGSWDKGRLGRAFSHRILEHRAGAELVGNVAMSLDLVDGQDSLLASQLNNALIPRELARLTNQVASMRPEVVVTHSTSSMHQDHNHAGDFFRSFAKIHQIPIVSVCDRPHVVCQGGCGMVREALRLTPTASSQKRMLLQEHPSQLPLLKDAFGAQLQQSMDCECFSLD